MLRHRCTPRPDWRDRVSAVGLTYHSHESGPYWDESAAYELSAREVADLEAAGNALHKLCIEAAEAVITRGLWDRLRIPQAAVPGIIRSWERDDFSLYGRFDLSYDGLSAPKLLEYNADTPTALVEASVAQWFWLLEERPGTDQFNSIHERLIQAWQRWAGRPVWFSSLKEEPEDEQTVLYLLDTSHQAGVEAHWLYLEDMGWDSQRNRFVDLSDTPLDQCFKLYPWEWLWHEQFGPHLLHEGTQFIEPTWKMLLSNKGLLPVLWELFPDHPNLLPAFDAPESLGHRYVRKPILSREGNNVSWIENGVVLEETGGDYGEEGYVYQAVADLPDFDGNRPIFGVWIVDHEAAGLGIREAAGRITTNLSRFVPHFFAPSNGSERP